MTNPQNKQLDNALRDAAVRHLEDIMIKGDPNKPRGGLLSDEVKQSVRDNPESARRFIRSVKDALEEPPAKSRPGKLIRNRYLKG